MEVRKKIRRQAGGKERRKEVGQTGEVAQWLGMHSVVELLPSLSKSWVPSPVWGLEGESMNFKNCIPSCTRCFKNYKNVIDIKRLLYSVAFQDLAQVEFGVCVFTLEESCLWRVIMTL